MNESNLISIAVPVLNVTEGVAAFYKRIMDVRTAWDDGL